MDRREFFKSALKRGARSAVNHAEQQVEQKAKQWIRPPFAIAELDFLLSCSRCGDCIAACPHQVVFALPARLGAKVVGTPALDLLNKGCHLCSDWPCVEACNETALALPEINPAQTPPPESDPPKPALTPQLLPPKLATLTINVETCLPYQGPECGACDNSCPLPGALRWDGVRPVIDDEVCVGCGLCRQACILEPKAIGVGA